MPIHEATKKLNETYRDWKAQSEHSDSHPARSILDRISDKWSLIILITLAVRSYRFGELKREIPDISQRVLTKTLTDLQRDGLITRTVYATKPPSVVYSLTSLGASVMPPMWELVCWANNNFELINQKRRAFDKGKSP